jgi:cytochrome c-type biogenesis protein
MNGQFNLLLVFGAGLTSVLSPCVLPVIPIIVLGTEKDHRLRPLLVVTGLATTFILMGIVSSLFGAVIGPTMNVVEKIAGVAIILFGVLMLLDINLFKHLTFLQSFGSKSKGSFSGFLLGLTLGVVWIPCIGPMLSSVLTLVATNGKLLNGIVMLSVYAAGFAVPFLIAGYASQLFRSNVSFLRKYPLAVRIISGSVLIVLGLVITLKGMVIFGAF